LRSSACAVHNSAGFSGNSSIDSYSAIRRVTARALTTTFNHVRGYFCEPRSLGGDRKCEENRVTKAAARVASTMTCQINSRYQILHSFKTKQNCITYFCYYLLPLSFVTSVRCTARTKQGNRGRSNPVRGIRGIEREIKPE